MTPKPSNAKHAATYRAKQAARVKAMREALEAIVKDGRLGAVTHSKWIQIPARDYHAAVQALAPQGGK